MNAGCNSDSMEDAEQDINWGLWTGLVAFVDILGGRGLYLSKDDSAKEKLEIYSQYLEMLNPDIRDDRAVLCFSDSLYFVQDVKLEEGMSGDIFPKQAIDFLNYYQNS